MPHSRTISLVCLALALLGQAADGCPYSLRQVGFVELRSRPYRVYCYVDAHTPNRELLAKVFAPGAFALDESNVTAKTIDADRDPDNEALVYLGALDSEELPAAVVVAPDERVMRIDEVTRQATDERKLRAALERLVESDKRDEITMHIVTQWCVVLLVEGADAAENDRARREIAAAIKAFAGTTTPLGDKVESPPVLVTVAANDPEERAMLWSLDMGQDDPPHAQAVVLFGQCRQIGPVLSGKALNKGQLIGLFNTLGINCACTTDTRFLAGPRLPVRWGEAMQKLVREHVGFDPMAPKVRMELARVWKDLGWDGGASASLMGYQEGTIEVSKDDAQGPRYIVMPTVGAARRLAGRPGAATGTNAPTSPLAAAVAAQSVATRMTRQLAAAVGLMLVVVAAGTLALLWRKRRT